jgi:hypothetical protein
MCRYNDRRCEVLTSTVFVVRELMSDIDVMVLIFLYRCEQNREYIARVSRGVDMPYMSVKHSLDRLVELRAVRPIEEKEREFRYFQLTPYGHELAVVLDRGCEL